MVDVLLLIATIVISILMFFVSFYIFIIYSHPEEKKVGSKLFYKILIVMGWGIVFSFVLILPLDVANSRGAGSGLNIDIIWNILIIILFVLIGFLYPFGIILYEEDEEKPLFGRIFKSFIFSIIIFGALGVLALISFGFLNVSYIPVNIYNENITNLLINSNSINITNFPAVKKTEFLFPIPPILFIIIFLMLAGWFLFVCFFGIGLTSLPLDLILDFIYRPKLLSDFERAKKKIQLKKRTNNLITETRNYISYIDTLNLESKKFFGRWKLKREKNAKFNKLKNDIFKLENEVEIFDYEENLNGNIIFNVFKLIFGIICSIFSLFLLIHMIVYILVNTNQIPASTFLNNFLLWTERVTPFFSTMVFAWITIYIMLATISGNFKFGFRILIFWTIHPMKKNGTWINSFLFNIILILLTCLPIIHFCTDLFSDFVTLSSSYLLFGLLVRKLKFFQFFFDNNIFYYILLGWSILTLLYWLFKSKKDRTDTKKMLKNEKEIIKNQ